MKDHIEAEVENANQSAKVTARRAPKTRLYVKTDRDGVPMFRKTGQPVLVVRTRGQKARVLTRYGAPTLKQLASGLKRIERRKRAELSKLKIGQAEPTIIARLNAIKDRIVKHLREVTVQFPAPRLQS